jgi:peptidoglycan/xylan/chitin deacetylase (PgdA/CDA1 family)
MHAKFIFNVIFVCGALSFLSISQIATSCQLESGNTETYKNDVSGGSSQGSSNNNNNKVVIVNLYDSNKNQFTNAKPILDKYGFKATFFIVCNWNGLKTRMSWQVVNQLHKEGHDIESHSMTHKRLVELSPVRLEYEIGQSKQCIYDQIGVRPTVFSPPHNVGWHNVTVIKTIAKYYDLSIGGFVKDAMFLPVCVYHLSALITLLL